MVANINNMLQSMCCISYIRYFEYFFHYFYYFMKTMMWVSNLIRTDMNVVMNCDFIFFNFF